MPERGPLSDHLIFMARLSPREQKCGELQPEKENWNLSYILMQRVPGGVKEVPNTKSSGKTGHAVDKGKETR